MSHRDHDNRDGGRDSRGSGNDKRDFYQVNDKRVSGRDYCDSRSWKGDRDSDRDTGGRDNSRKSRSRSRRRLEVPQTGSSKSGFPPAPPPHDRDRHAPRHPSPDRMINDATSLLKTLHMSGDLPSLGRGLSDRVRLDLFTTLCKNIDDKVAPDFAASKEVQGMVKQLTPHLKDVFAQWSSEERAPFFVCPKHLNPELGQGGTENDRIKNGAAINDELRERFKPITSEKQRHFIDQFKFKVLPLSQKAFRRFWDTAWIIPWKTKIAEWAQFRKHVEAFKYEPDKFIDDCLDPNTRDLEELWARLLGKDAYAEEFEKDEEADPDAEGFQATHRGVGESGIIKYSAKAITSLYADSDGWEEVRVDIPIGEEVAVLITDLPHHKIRFKSTIGWVDDAFLTDAQPIVRRYIDSADNPVELLDDAHKALQTKLEHGASVSVKRKHKGWSNISCPALSVDGWVRDNVLVAEAPTAPANAGKSDKHGKGKGDKRGKGAMKGKVKADKGKRVTYDVEDFKKEEWPKFALTGPKECISKLSADAAKRLQVAMEALPSKDKRVADRFTTKYAEDLDKLFPDDLDKDGDAWAILKETVNKLSINAGNVRWGREGVTAQLKTLFLRLRTTRELDPSA